MSLALSTSRCRRSAFVCETRLLRVQRRRPDTSWVYVNIGLGFHAQMTPTEAISFSNQREKALSEAAEALTQRAATLKAKIKLTMGAIDEIIAGGAV